MSDFLLLLWGAFTTGALAVSLIMSRTMIIRVERLESNDRINGIRVDNALDRLAAAEYKLRQTLTVAEADEPYGGYVLPEKSKARDTNTKGVPIGRKGMTDETAGNPPKTAPAMEETDEKRSGNHGHEDVQTDQ